MKFKLILASLLILPVLSGCVAGTANSASPSSPTPSDNATSTPTDRVPRMSIDELLKKINSGSDMLIVDARRDVIEQFKISHIKGAIEVPPDTITAGQWSPPADLNKEIVIYCSCPNEETSASAALLLISRGYTNVKALKGGWNAWKEAGYPIESGTN
ncbi:MAG: rhodanese-like domain-containing protein [Dehalococcoidia bacterium]